jgi:hypothetical protein
MTGNDTSGRAGAQVVAFGTDNNLYTAFTTGSNGSWSWTEVPPAGCTPAANPGITEYNTGLFAIGTTCYPSENLSWRTLTTP